MAYIRTITSIERKKERIVQEKEKINEEALCRFKKLLEENREKPIVEDIEAAQETAEKIEQRIKDVDDRDGLAMERIIYDSDLFPISYLQSGFNVGNSICRIALSDRVGRILGYGTGFLISPSIIITNNHVLDRKDTALYSIAEFNCQLDENNLPCRSASFRLDPDKLFITDKRLDFTIVAVKESSGDKRRLTDFGYLELSPNKQNIIENEYVSIIQHPKGGPKAVTVRENKVKFLMDDFIHYLTDTEPGSSGSPVFNDQWKVIALHHSGVPDPNDNTQWIANEGIRISSILDNLNMRMDSFDSKTKEMLGKIINIDKKEPTQKPIKTGDLDDTWYEKLPGYNKSFLEIDVPLPSLDRAREEDTVVTNEGKKILDYTNFSLVMSKSRRLAFFTAVNIDGENYITIKRGSDRWFFDKRIDEKYQCGNDLYKNNKLDRGHLVRRLEPNWGDDAKIANDATFHYTNCSPQHMKLNQRTWLNLEDYILNAAKKHSIKVSVFTGPVFSPSDMIYRGVKIPAEFWKVAVMVKKDGKLSATAYLQTQKNLIEDLEFAFGEYKTYQVSIRQIEALTGLDFGNLRDYDPISNNEEGFNAVTGRIVESLEDIKI